ncbi:MAG TPA: hypothetical protein VJW17_14340 [Pyrinomonadaceae bacterium]|nr:hypothetical protein [Pyrinomonadaceae bacterium]
MNETPSVPVILNNEQQAVFENSKPKPSTAAPKWETAARERMRTAIKKFAKPRVLTWVVHYQKVSQTATWSSVRGTARVLTSETEVLSMDRRRSRNHAVTRSHEGQIEVRSVDR